MIEDQLRSRLRTTAEGMDRSVVPLADIRTAGRTIARRRTGARVLVGLAAVVVAVSGVALTTPAGSRTADDPGPATSTPSPYGSRCIGDLVEVQSETGPLCASTRVGADDEPWPGPEGLRKEMEIELRSAGSAQRLAFRDDRITKTEYRAGFERFRECLADAGFDIGSGTETEFGITYSVPAEAVDTGADKTCYDRHFKAMDMAWQIPRAD
ncbi:MAG: hypothetical protein Q7T71_15900, partial [Herbiconiux sp.]|nr:hypothetical protein [Herbiconiux sp.]